MSSGVTVLLFGQLRDLAGWSDRVVTPTPATLSALKASLTQLDARLGQALESASVKVAVDRVITDGDPRLHPQAEIAFLPPMSGG